MYLRVEEKNDHANKISSVYQTTKNGRRLSLLTIIESSASHEGKNICNTSPYCNFLKLLRNLCALLIHLGENCWFGEEGSISGPYREDKIS